MNRLIFCSLFWPICIIYLTWNNSLHSKTITSLFPHRAWASTLDFLCQLTLLWPAEIYESNMYSQTDGCCDYWRYFASAFADARGTSSSRMGVLLQGEKVSNAEKAVLCCKRCLMIHMILSFLLRELGIRISGLPGLPLLSCTEDF